MKLETKDTIENNIEVLRQYVEAGELDKAAILLELLRLQLKIALDQDIEAGKHS